MIDRDTIDRIYAAANIVDIVGDYVTLKRKGVNYQACCPFHNEKTPSFVVSPTKGLFKCFGCGKAGNAVTFVMEHESITYPEALRAVAKRYGIEVKEQEMTEEQLQRNDDRESMFTLNSWAADYFASYLYHQSEGIGVGMSYLRQKRSMTDAMIKRFALGFCPSKGDTMSQEALKAGYKEDFLVSTGLSLKSDKDGSLFDRFRDRVMFPIHNISGRVVGFGGRTLREDKKVAKYQNSPESEIYSKKRELYGLFFAKRAIQLKDCAIMVEGYTDVISMHQVGIENVVASSGTSLTVEQIRLLARFTRNITIIYDGDTAGIKASMRGVDMILSEGMNVRIVTLPDGDDPDSFASQRTAEEVESYIAENEHDFLAFKAQLLLEESKGDPIKKSSLIGDMIASITHIPDNIQRSVYIKECARIMDVDEALLVSEVARRRMTSSGDREADEFIRRQNTLERQAHNATQGIAQGATQADFSKRVEAGSSFEALECEIVKYMLKYGDTEFDFIEGSTVTRCNVAESIFGELDGDNITFRNPTYAKIMQIYKREWEAAGIGEKVAMHHFINSDDASVCNLSVDILTSEENYVPSQMWRQKDVYVETDEDMLSVGVPKAVTLYKSKVVEDLISQLQTQLTDESLTEEQMRETLQRLASYNSVKVAISKRLQRLIL